VQAYKDFHQYDLQVYTSLSKSGEECPNKNQELMEYVSTQAVLYNNGESNAITDILAGTDAEGMLSSDFMNYMADIPAGKVQYGQRTTYCDFLATNASLSMEELFNLTVTTEESEENYPISYDTSPGSKITETTIDTTYSSRQWSY
jgi:hypothetical protein